MEFVPAYDVLVDPPRKLFEMAEIYFHVSSLWLRQWKQNIETLPSFKFNGIIKTKCTQEVLRELTERRIIQRKITGRRDQNEQFYFTQMKIN